MFNIKQKLLNFVFIQREENNKAFSDKKIIVVSTIFSICLFVVLFMTFAINENITVLVKIPILIVCFLVSYTIGYFIWSFWKKWPYTVKIALITGGIAMLFNILLYYCMYRSSFSISEYAGFGCIIFLIPEEIALLPLDFLNLTGLFNEAYLPIISSALWIFAGILIGFIFDYIKLKRAHKCEPC